jgi:hypothetical protein
MKKILVLFVAILILVAGCESFKGFGGKEDTSKQRIEKPNVQYFTFSDIPFPSEMSVDRDKTFVYETPALKAGVLVLSGNVDMASLETYFKVNMDKNGWRFVNSFNYSNIAMNFVKGDRASSITISREPFTTIAEIKVGPIDRSSTDRGPVDKGPASSNTIMPKENGWR